MKKTKIFLYGGYVSVWNIWSIMLPTTLSPWFRCLIKVMSSLLSRCTIKVSLFISTSITTYPNSIARSITNKFVSSKLKMPLLIFTIMVLSIQILLPIRNYKISFKSLLQAKTFKMAKIKYLSPPWRPSYIPSMSPCSIQKKYYINFLSNKISIMIKIIFKLAKLLSNSLSRNP